VRQLEGGVRAQPRPAYGSYFHAGTGQDFGPTLQTAVELGAPLIRVWAGPRGIAPAAASQALSTRCVQELQLACDAAAEHGIALGLEFHRLTLTEGERSTLYLLTEARRANLRTYWQPLPGVTSDMARRQLEALAPYLGHLHVFQWDEDLGRHPLREGEAFWRDVLQAQAPTLGVERWALLEFLPADDPALLPSEAGVLRAWLQRLASSPGRSDRPGLPDLRSQFAFSPPA
jgi:sugar phosphate isomerase/epimerase